jgi:hypothetical protein
VIDMRAFEWPVRDVIDSVRIPKFTCMLQP